VVRCFNCGKDNLDRAMFCEMCGTRLVLPPIDAQPMILNTGEGKILGFIPRVALVPIIGLILGAFAYLLYAIGLMMAVDTLSDPGYDPFSSDWSSGPQAMFVLSAVLGVVAAILFFGGIIRLVLNSD
jgi:hypothetical protein